MADYLDNPAVVIDNGTGVCKAGFAGEETPLQVFAAMVGYPKAGGSTATIGDDCLEDKERLMGLQIKYPIEHGIVQDWDEMERLWRTVFEKLETTPEKQALLLTEPALNPRANREKMLEVVFEKLQVPATYVCIQALLSLYSGGRSSGLVVDVGDGVTHVVPVSDGHTVRNAILRAETAGRDLTRWMMELLTNDCKHPFTTTADQEIAREIKEKCCFVSKSWDEDLAQIDQDIACMDMEYTMPDGKILYVGRPRFACPEALFQPEIMGREELGIHQVSFNAIMRCDIDMRKELYNNVVCSGGSTCFPGFGERLEAELNVLAPPAATIRVLTPPERKYSVWMGAALLGSLASFQNSWITKQEYDEAGAGIVHRRCDSLISALPASS